MEKKNQFKYQNLYNLITLNDNEKFLKFLSKNNSNTNFIKTSVDYFPENKLLYNELKIPLSLIIQPFGV